MKFPDFSQIKQTTDIVHVVESYGVKLTKAGKEYRGNCPFHEDTGSHLYVNREKGVCFCQVCGETGNVIQFVAKKEGINEKEAALKLCSQIPGVQRHSPSEGGKLKEETEPVFSQPLVSAVERATLLKRVVSFYAKTLMQARDGFDYLKSRNLSDPTMLEVFQVGYCNGTLNKVLPRSGEMIEQLKAIGILDKSGREILRGRVTVPIFDVHGNVSSLYGRKVGACDSGERHRYLKSPSTLLGTNTSTISRGVWNGACGKTSQSIFITESIFDGMALWQAGFKNVICVYGNQGWTPEHDALFRENPVREVFLCLDNDEAGQAATERLKEKLSGVVKAVHVIEWPSGSKDACDFFIPSKLPASTSSGQVGTSTRTSADFEKLVKNACPTSLLSPQTMSDASKDAEEITMSAEGFIAAYGVRRYELRAIEKPSPARLKATIKCSLKAESRPLNASFHIDTVDFYLSRSRRGFIVEAARLFQEVPEVIELDINRLIVQLESYAAKRLEEKTPHITLVSEGDKAEALKLGRNPDFVREILKDMEKLGLVGEQSNGLLGYLAMTSRKMDDPLALLILSCSGAGKSHLQDTILSFCPDEDLVKVTSLSDQALYYKGEDALKHKVLAIEEEAGALGADYAIRNLISAKKLVREVTIKNPLTGKMETQTCRVNGPASVLKTTTNPETNAETRSRFFITSVDESSEQTLAILAAQRQSHTLDGLLKKKQAAVVLARQHAFQRLLKPLHVVNPFEPLLTYGDDRLLIRRDNPKYLRLILVVAFLHQMQRPIKTHPELGEFIEVTLDDIAVANDLAVQLFGYSVDDLSAPGRELLRLIRDYVHRQAADLKVEPLRLEFSRRQLRQTLKWSEYRLRCHLRELERMEYLVPLAGRHGQLYSYRLLDHGGEDESRHLPGLKNVDQIRQEAEKARILVATSLTKKPLRWSKSNFVGTSLEPINEVFEGGFHPATEGTSRRNGHAKVNFVGVLGEPIPVLCKNGEKGSVISIINGNGVGMES